MKRSRTVRRRPNLPSRSTPLLVAIVGGSGSGKSWLADKLAALLHPRAARISQDDFYRDRSALPAHARERANFDHPRAIEWPKLENALLALFAGFRTEIPCYSFKTHSRLKRVRTLKPKPVIILDGLWLLRPRALRALYGLRVFLDCPTGTRLRRRVLRDLRSRGRNRESVLNQFWCTVEPMHCRYVAPQARYADVILTGKESPARIKQLAMEIGKMATKRDHP